MCILKVHSSTLLFWYTQLIRKEQQDLATTIKTSPQLLNVSMIACLVLFTVALIFGRTALWRFRRKYNEKQRIDAEDAQRYWRSAWVGCILMAASAGIASPMVVGTEGSEVPLITCVGVAILLSAIGGCLSLLGVASLIYLSRYTQWSHDVILEKSKDRPGCIPALISRWRKE